MWSHRWKCIEILALALTALTVGAQAPTWKGYVFGRVVDSAGKPAPDAVVEVMRSKFERLPELLEQNAFDHAYVCATARTNKAGKFAIEVDPGALLGVRASSAAPAFSPTLQPVRSGESVVLKLMPAQYVTGRIVEGSASDRALPIHGARVFMELDRKADYASLPEDIQFRPIRARAVAASDADGKFRILAPKSMDASLTVVTRSGNARVSLTDHPDPHKLEVDVSRPNSEMHGVLRDSGTKEPVAGATVRYLDVNSEGVSTVSDSQGRFRLTRPQRMGLSRIAILPLAHRSAKSEFQLSDADDPVEIELVRGLHLTARLLASDGEPLAGARLAFSGEADWMQRLGPDGEFDLGCLHPGKPLSGFVEVDNTFVRFVRIVPKKDVALGDMKIALSATIRGGVVDHKGARAPHATVFILPETPEDAPEGWATHWDKCFVQADSSGRFLIPKLLPGRYRLAATSELGAPGFATVDVTATTSPVTVSIGMPEGGSSHGQVVDENGQRVAGIGVYLYNLAPSEAAREFGLWNHAATADAAGDVVFKGLPKDAVFAVQASGLVAGKHLHRHMKFEISTGDEFKVEMR